MHLYRISSRLLLLAAFLISGSCTGTRELQEPAVGAPIDVPDHFLVGTFEGSETREPLPDNLCRNPMVDPRDGTQVLMVTTSQGLGDYEVPDGRYGVGQRQLLRLDCGTGKAVAIVRRQK